VGETEKFAPLALEPMLVPFVETVYHLIVFPADVADKFVLEPLQIAEGDAVTAVGAFGMALIVRLEPLSTPVVDGELDTTLILYPLPKGVLEGMVAGIAPSFFAVSVPIAIGELNDPDELLNCAVKTLVLSKVPPDTV
jgi:hypothetical protein